MATNGHGMLLCRLYQLALAKPVSWSALVCVYPSTLSITVPADQTSTGRTQLSYTRGTVIPLHLTVRSSDTHALDLLSSPTAPVVRLRRVTRNHYDDGGPGITDASAGKEHKLADLKSLPTPMFQDLVGYVNSATWWSTPSSSDDAGTRTLQGEVHLPPNLRSNVYLGLFRYFVSLLPFCLF